MYKPISKELFADLLVYLDSVSIGTKCDDISMKHSEEFLRSRSKVHPIVKTKFRHR